MIACTYTIKLVYCTLGGGQTEPQWQYIETHKQFENLFLQKLKEDIKS